MDFVSQVCGDFSLDAVEQQQIDDYAGFKAQEWINTEKYDWEIEAHIKNQINDLIISKV